MKTFKALAIVGAVVWLLAVFIAPPVGIFFALLAVPFLLIARSKRVQEHELRRMEEKGLSPDLTERLAQLKEREERAKARGRDRERANRPVEKPGLTV